MSKFNSFESLIIVVWVNMCLDLVRKVLQRFQS